MRLSGSLVLRSQHHHRGFSQDGLVLGLPQVAYELGSVNFTHIVIRDDETYFRLVKGQLVYQLNGCFSAVGFSHEDAEVAEEVLQHLGNQRIVIDYYYFVNSRRLDERGYLDGLGLE